jgi:hypothetical protein
MNVALIDRGSQLRDVANLRSYERNSYIIIGASYFLLAVSAIFLDLGRLCFANMEIDRDICPIVELLGYKAFFLGGAGVAVPLMAIAGRMYCQNTYEQSLARRISLLTQGDELL